jgi:hypothetical protein
LAYPSLHSWALAGPYQFQITAVQQLLYTGTNAAEWLFHQEKATLQGGGNGK